MSETHNVSEADSTPVVNFYFGNSGRRFKLNPNFLCIRILR